MISAYEIETAGIGAGARLTSTEQQAAVREAVRAAVYDPASGKVKIELIKPRDDERPTLSGGNIQRGDVE